MKNKGQTITITLPSFPIREYISKVKNYMLYLLSELKSKFSLNFTRRTLNPKNFYEKNKNLKRYLPYIIIAIFVLLTLMLGGVAIRNISIASSKPTVADAKASNNIGREFSFPLVNASGEKVSEVRFVFEKAELRDEIIVQGQKANSVKGRVFFVLNLKIINEHNQAVEINTRDYVRLAVSGNESEWLAPEIHNDPVEVQPISTKYTRLGFTINETDKNLTLRVGEISGEKEEITISFK